MSGRDHNKAALEFLWEVFEFLCITIVVCAVGLAAFVVVCMAIDQTPLLWRWVIGVLLGTIGGLYWLGYGLSKEMQSAEEYEERFTAEACIAKSAKAIREEAKAVFTE